MTNNMTNNNQEINNAKYLIWNKTALGNPAQQWREKGKIQEISYPAKIGSFKYTQSWIW